MDAANIDVHSVKTEIKLEEHDEPEELTYCEIKEERFENNDGQLFQYPSESVILYKSERLKYEEPDIKSETNETYICPNTFFKSEHQHEEKIPEYECKECGFRTVHSSSLKRHLHHHRKSNKLKLYLYKPSMQNVECPNCDYQTNDRSNLRRHIIYHCVLSSGKSRKSNKTYTCYHCGHNASTKSNLKVHIFRKHRPKEEVKYCCEECNYQPVSKSDLQIHKLSHKNAKHMKVYKCLYCKYQTIYKVSIDRHMVSHKAAHERDMYQCYLCKYKAVRKDELRNHILRHAKKPLKKSKR